MNENSFIFPKTWAVLGATGFVGSALVAKLRKEGEKVIEVRAPRLESDARALKQLEGASEQHHDHIARLAHELSGADVVVNGAGLAKPGAGPSDQLFGANSLLPLIVASAAQHVGAERLLHISSAAVQGARRVLDSTDCVEPFSPYSESKALGEQAVLQRTSSETFITVVRATSVQGPNRETTRRLRRLARSRLSSVASPGDQRTAVSSIDGLVDFIFELGTQREVPPSIVLQPWEGGTVSSVLSLAGDGRAPIVLPAALCRSIIWFGKSISRMLGGRLAAQARRIELMWFGQMQEEVHFPAPARPSRGLWLALTESADSHIEVM